jgi:Mg-chelatase subunit ChlD
LSGSVELSQGFTNPYDQPLEATYIFPMPDRFAVTGMRMTADDRVIEAVLRERAAAREEYERAVAEGKRASIAEEERPDVFTMRVGNILPGERVSIALTLAGALSYEDGEATFRFPLVVAPRYIPGDVLSGQPVGDGYAPDTDAVPDASRITPPVLLPGFPHPVRLGIEVVVDPAGLPLGEVRSSLPTQTGPSGVVRVTPGQRADRDFLLRLRYGEPVHVSSSLVLVSDVEGPEGTFQLTLLPPADAAPPRPRDLVLVLDRSGSMQGWKMVAARRAAARIVDTLTGADRFAVLTFDSVVERPENLPEGLVEATDRHRFRAVEHLARAQARGGTEMLAPLREALRLLTGDGAVSGVEARDRVLVLVTDGQVGNEEQILREVVAGGLAVRMHTVGIDQAVNAGFLGRLASFGGGRCELVESEDRLDEAMDHIHRRIGAPVVTGLTLDAAGSPGGLGQGRTVLADTLSPARLPDLFPGAPVVVTGRFSDSHSPAPETATPAPAQMAVSGQTGDGKPWRAEVKESTVDGGGPAALTAIWARGHLRDLEDRYAAIGVLRAPGDADTAALEQTIVATSLRFGVLCRFTAYVAVDTRVVTDGGTPHRVIQPVEPAAGWDMLAAGQAGMGSAAPPMPMVMQAAAGPRVFGGSVSRGRRAMDAGGPVGAGGLAASMGGMSGPMAPMGIAPGGAGLGAMAPAELAKAKPPLVAAREQATQEARRLREAAALSVQERRDVLLDLGTRLAALVAELTAHGVAREAVTPVAELVTAIQAGVPTGAVGLDELWRRALAVLDNLIALDVPATRPRAFWKR